MLVNKDYYGLETLTNGIRLKAEHLETAVAEYGRTLTEPPDSAYNDADIVHVDGSSPSQYSIRFRLFTEEEGQSDLELQATLFDETSYEVMRVEIDNVLVA